MYLPAMQIMRMRALRAAAGGRAGRKKEECGMKSRALCAAIADCEMQEMMKNEPSRIRGIESNPSKSDQIKPNPTKKRSQRGSRRRPLDQNWGGQNSSWVERVGGEEVLNG